MVDGYCGNLKLLDMYIGVLDLLQNAIVVVLPVPVLWGMPKARSTKVSLSCMFGIGIMYGTQNRWLIIFSQRELLTNH